MLLTNTHLLRKIFFAFTSLAVICLALAVVNAQCPGSTLTGGLLAPSKLVQSPLANLIVAESGSTTNGGRISIVDLSGNRRTLLDGLPAAINSAGDMSGPGAVYLVGRTLYISTGEGDSTIPGPIPGTELPNPAPSSPLFSSIIAVHLSAAAEKTSGGFTLTLADQQALKDGETLTLTNGGGDRITLSLVIAFPNFVADPLPFFPPNVRHSNPYGLTSIGDQLYVADAGLNAVRKVDIDSGATSILTTFPPIPNSLPFGPPVIEAVPDNIHDFNGDLYVPLLRGFPFPAGLSTIMKVDPATGAAAPFINGLTSSIDILPVKTKGSTSYLTLEIASDTLLAQPGRLQKFSSPSGPGTVISSCLIGPNSMVRDAKTGTLYITENFTGRIIQIPGQ